VPFLYLSLCLLEGREKKEQTSCPITSPSPSPKRISSFPPSPFPSKRKRGPERRSLLLLFLGEEKEEGERIEETTTLFT